MLRTSLPSTPTSLRAPWVMTPRKRISSDGSFVSGSPWIGDEGGQVGGGSLDDFERPWRGDAGMPLRRHRREGSVIRASAYLYPRRVNTRGRLRRSLRRQEE